MKIAKGVLLLLTASMMLGACSAKSFSLSNVERHLGLKSTSVQNAQPSPATSQSN